MRQSLQKKMHKKKYVLFCKFNCRFIVKSFLYTLDGGAKRKVVWFFLLCLALRRAKQRPPSPLQQYASKLKTLIQIKTPPLFLVFMLSPQILGATKAHTQPLHHTANARITIVIKVTKQRERPWVHIKPFLSFTSHFLDSSKYSPPEKNKQKMAPVLPPVLWAQRKDVILVTVQVQDATEVAIKVLPSSVEISCKSDGKEYATTLPLLGEVVAEESSYVARPRQIEMKLQKKEQGPYWDGLTSSKQRHVKIDWPRWVDEEEETGAGTGDFGVGGNFGQNGFEGLPGGMEGLGGVNLGGGGDPEKIQAMLDSMGNDDHDHSGVQEIEDDDDDDDMPALEKK